jgi:hypothetical protein
LKENRRKSSAAFRDILPECRRLFAPKSQQKAGAALPFLPASRPGGKEERTSGIGQKKESEKLRFVKFWGEAFAGKPEPLSPCPAAFFDAQAEKIRKNPLSKPKITVKMHNRTFTK